MKQELPRRKRLRLPEHDYSHPGYYFVTVCTHLRQKLFQHLVGAHLCVRPPTRDSFLTMWLYELERKYPGVRIDCWAIIPDHLHVILAITGAHIGAPLHEIIKWYKTQTTNDYIRQVKQGVLPPFQTRIWQRGYYDHVIRNDTDLTEIRRYILENPIQTHRNAK